MRGALQSWRGLGVRVPGWQHACGLASSCRRRPASDGHIAGVSKSSSYQASRICWSSASGSQEVSSSEPTKTLSFRELGIDKDLYDKTSGIRFRQHVNPLKKELQEPTKPLNWSSIYEDPTKPLILDIGAGYGRFLLGLMQVETSKNGLGLEIRDPIIKRANEWAMHLNLDSRVHFVRSNATVSVSTLLSTYPGPIELVTIQFPDPHFKKKHRKRRIVQESLVKDLSGVVGVGGRVLLQSDVLGVATDMRDKFERYGGGAWRLGGAHDGDVFFEEEGEEDDDETGQGAEDVLLETLVFKEKGWLTNNPLPVRTERECLVMEQGGSVYRVMLERI